MFRTHVRFAVTVLFCCFQTAFAQNHNIVTVAGGGSDIGEGGPATLARLNAPAGIVFDFWGNVYIADTVNERIRKVDTTTGIITTIAGTGVAGFSGDGGLATIAQLNAPTGLAFDFAGNLYIADRLNNRVRMVNTITGVITTIAGTGIAGFSGDGVPATAARLNNPRSLAFDFSGNLYITDTINERVRMVNTITGMITTIAGTGIAGFSGDGVPATAARLNNPRSLAFDFSGNLYITDTGNERIRKVDTTTGIITTIAGTGVAGFSGDGGLATMAQLNAPTGLAFDFSGNLYITDTINERIRKVDTITGIITTIAGTGIVGFFGDGGPATAAPFNSPMGLAFDSGNLYIADRLNNRVRRLNVAVSLNLNPNTLSISSNGGWITTYMQFPADRDSSNVILASIRIQAIDPTSGAVRNNADQLLQMPRDVGTPNELIDTNNDGVPEQLMIKFDRNSVASWSTGATELVLRVEGRFDLGTYFSGDTQIRVK